MVIEKIFLLLFLGVIAFDIKAQDLVSGGTNSWIFHTPEDGRTSLYIAPKVGSTWAFSKQTVFNNDGTVGFNGPVSGPSFKVKTLLEIPDIHRTTCFKKGTRDGGTINDYNTFLCLHWGLGIGSKYTSDGSGDYEEKAMIAINGRNGDIISKGIISSSSVTTTSRFYKSTGSLGTDDPALLSAFSEHSLDAGGGELSIITLGYEQGISYGTDMDTKIWSYARNLNESRNFITIGRYRIDLSAPKIYTNGVIGIGTSVVGSHKLAVAGSIGAREIKVEANGWSDFVFDDDYDLKSIEEVENYIKENGHLSEIPDQKTVEKNGVNLGEMNAKLLEKIEELTLYTIDQQKEIEKLKDQNERLNMQNKKIEELEEIIKRNGLK
jgi:hypothetical protein